MAEPEYVECEGMRWRRTTREDVYADGESLTEFATDEANNEGETAVMTYNADLARQLGVTRAEQEAVTLYLASTRHWGAGTEVLWESPWGGNPRVTARFRLAEGYLFDVAYPDGVHYAVGVDEEFWQFHVLGLDCAEAERRRTALWAGA